MSRTLKFILGSPAEGQISDWYLYLDGGNSRPFAYRHISSQLVEANARWAYHDLSGTKPNWLNWLDFNTNALSGLHHQLFKNDNFYINRFGGMCKSLYNITNTQEVKENTSIGTVENWPTSMNPESMYKNVKISSWKGGKHYYAKLPDGSDVIIDGEMKWNSWKEAKEATKKYLGL